MIHIEEAVIVEGKYDKIKLSNFLDAMIVETGGFAIYKDKKLIAVYSAAWQWSGGFIILTDSDHSGFKFAITFQGIAPAAGEAPVYPGCVRQRAPQAKARKGG